MRKESAMQVSLGEILEWLEKHDPNSLKHLCSGASSEDIATVEKATGLLIPDDYKEFLRLHDGEDDTSWHAILGEGNQLLSCESIIYRFRLDEGKQSFMTLRKRPLSFGGKKLMKTVG